MPSRIRLDHSISGRDLDVLLEDRGREPVVARLWPALVAAGVLLLLVGLAARGLSVVAPPSPSMAETTTAPPTPVIDYATQPAMRIWCDGNPVDLVSASQVTTELTRTCWTDYGWCHECQLAWMRAHP